MFSWMLFTEIFNLQLHVEFHSAKMLKARYETQNKKNYYKKGEYYFSRNQCI